MKKRQLTTKKPPTERIIKDIRSLRDSGKSDIEIRKTLGIELRTFQRYTKTIYEKDQQVWFSITREQLATELLRLRSSLEETYIIAKKMSEDESADISDRLESLAVKDNTRVVPIKLLTEVPSPIKIKTQEQFPEMETETHYVSESEWRENGKRVLENAAG